MTKRRPKVIPFPGRSTGEEITPEGLVSAAGTGDQAALNLLYERFHKDVYAFLARLLNSTGPEIDDLVQATFMGVWKGARGFGGRSSVRTWILAIASNQAKSHFRAESRRRRAVEKLRLIPAQSNLVSEEERPDAQTARKQLLRQLAAAIETLPPKCRIAYVMCVIEEIPGPEAAAALRITKASLWRRVHDARKRLREMLEETR